MLEAILRPQPEHGAVGALPLVFVNRAGQKTLDVRACRCDTATDHLGNGACHHDRWQIRVQRRMGAAHGAFRAFAAQLLLSQPGHHNGQLMGRQCVGVVQHRCDGQVLASHGTIDDDL